MSEATRNLLDVSHLCKEYRQENRVMRAVNDVSFTIATGEVLGLVGESGCGKSTLGRTLLRLNEASSGAVSFDGQDIYTLSKQKQKSLRRDMQIIFQDPFASLNPRHRVSRILAEPLKVHRVGDKDDQFRRVAELLDMVGIPKGAASRFPHEFSGGQRQRIAIARALALRPRFLVADEAVSALDVSVQSQIINLFSSLRKHMTLTMLFISHDLSVIRHVSDRIAVMYLGRIVEIGDTEDILTAPQHPYTQALVSAIPNPLKLDSQRIILSGEIPDPAKLPVGCAFNTRCFSKTDKVSDRCIAEQPLLQDRTIKSSSGHVRHTACHLYPTV